MQLLYFESENKKNLDTVLNTIDAHMHIYIATTMCQCALKNTTTIRVPISKVTKIQKYNNLLLLINLV